MIVGFLHSPTQALSRPRSYGRSREAGDFVLKLLDIVQGHALSRAGAHHIAEPFRAHVCPAMVTLVVGVARQPGLVRGLLQADDRVDWPDSDPSAGDGAVLTAKVMADHLARQAALQPVSRGLRINARAAVPTFKEPDGLLLAHVGSAGLLQRVLYLLAALSHHDDGVAWLAHDATMLSRLGDAMACLAVYATASDRALQQHDLFGLCAPAAHATLGSAVPTLLVLLDNVTEFLGHPDRVLSPDDARRWREAVWPAVQTLVHTVLMPVPSSLLRQFFDYRRLQATQSLKNEANSDTRRKTTMCALYPFRRRGGLLQGRDHGPRVDDVVDILCLAADFVDHVRGSMAPRCALPDAEMQLARQVQAWINAQFSKESVCWFVCVREYVCVWRRSRTVVVG